MVRPRVFLDFSIDGAPAGRVIFELFNDKTPKTSENFRALCTGEMGISKLSERPLYYKNSIIHRSIKDFMIQGGDFTKRNGMGGESIYGGPFADEDLTGALDSEGSLCMANKGPDTNNSQFFITLRDCSHLNGKHVVFGKVIRGYETVQKISDVSVDAKDRPLAPVVISNCGELELRTKSTADSPHKESRKRSPSPRRSHTPESDHRSSKKRKHKKSKHERASGEHDAPAQVSKDTGPVAETEEEYDARLEREENERQEEERKRELERIKRKYEGATQSKDGVRFKGRGRMKFVDPEIQQARYP